MIPGVGGIPNVTHSRPSKQPVCGSGVCVGGCHHGGNLLTQSSTLHTHPLPLAAFYKRRSTGTMCCNLIVVFMKNHSKSLASNAPYVFIGCPLCSRACAKQRWDTQPETSRQTQLLLSQPCAP